MTCTQQEGTHKSHGYPEQEHFRAFCLTLLPPNLKSHAHLESADVNRKLKIPRSIIKYTVNYRKKRRVQRKAKPIRTTGFC